MLKNFVCATRMLTKSVWYSSLMLLTRGGEASAGHHHQLLTEASYEDKNLAIIYTIHLYCGWPRPMHRSCHNQVCPWRVRMAPAAPLAGQREPSVAAPAHQAACLSI